MKIVFSLSSTNNLSIKFMLNLESNEYVEHVVQSQI